MQVDLASGNVLDPLPFDVPFVIKGSTGDGLPKGTACVATEIVNPNDPSATQHLESWQPVPGTEPKAFYVRVEPLEPNTAYELKFTVVRRLSAEELGRARAGASRKLADIVKRAATGVDPTTDVVKSFSDAADKGAGLCRRKRTEETTKDLYKFAGLAIAAHREAITRHGSWVTKRAQLRSSFDALRAAADEFAAALSGSGEDAMWSLRIVASLSSAEFDLLSSGEATLEGKALKPAVGEGRRPIDESSGLEALQARIQALDRTALTLREIDGFLRQSLAQLALRSQREVGLIKLAAADFEGLAEGLKQMATHAEARDRAIDAAAERGGGSLSSDAITVSSPRKGNYAGNAAAYISLDLGLAFFPDFRRSAYAPYAGANIYFRPVNKEAYLNVTDFPRDILQRVALIVGTTITTIEETDRRKGLFGHSGLLLGLGMRVQSYIRVSSGAVLFLALDPHPLGDDRDLAVSPFISASIDLDIANLFGGVRTTVFGAK